jgi:hypothetical protein
MKMSADVFLSRAEIKYDQGLSFVDPARLVETLIVLNNTRTWDSSLADFVYNTHQAEGFEATPASAVSTSPAMVFAEGKAAAAYMASLKSGKPGVVYAAFDAWMAVRQAKGGESVAVCMSDFDILSEGVTDAGEVARRIKSLRQAVAAGVEVGTDELPYGALCPWFDTKAAADSLTEYATGA